MGEEGLSYVTANETIVSIHHSELFGIFHYHLKDLSFFGKPVTISVHQSVYVRYCSIQYITEMDEFIKRNFGDGMLPYKQELDKLAVTSESTLKYLRPREVYSLDIPEVYKRMLVDKIVTLQTPDRQAKMKRQLESPVGEESNPLISPAKDTSTSASRNVRPKLSSTKIEFPNETADRSAPESCVSLETQLASINDDKASLILVLQQKRDELKLLNSPTEEQLPLAIPGVALLKSVCDNCHHKGHRTSGNKGNRNCPYSKCPGYHYCGLQNKHKEHRSEVLEVSSFVHTHARTYTSHIHTAKWSFFGVDAYSAVSHAMQINC
jgi:hypothetical protein